MVAVTLFHKEETRRRSHTPQRNCHWLRYFTCDIFSQSEFSGNERAAVVFVSLRLWGEKDSVSAGPGRRASEDSTGFFVVFVILYLWKFMRTQIYI